MFLTIFDLVLILFLFCFIAFGFALGLVQTVGSILGLVLGVWLAGLYYLPFSDWLTPILLGHENAAKIIAFIIIFIAINRLVGFVFYILNRIFDFISFLPFLKTINRLTGALLGLAEGVLILGVILYVAARYLEGWEWLVSVIASSKVALYLVSAANILTPLLPEMLRQLKAII